MRNKKITLHSPISTIQLPARVADLLGTEGMEVVFDIYYHELRKHKKTPRHITGGLREIKGFGRAAYRDVQKRLKVAGLPNLKEAPRLIRQSESVLISELNDGASSG